MKRKFRVYPQQSKYVKGNKIWLELGNDQTLVVSPQARDVIAFYGIDEPKLIEKLKELLNECFTDLDCPFHCLTVSKSNIPELSDAETEIPHLKIEILDSWKNQ